MQLQVQRLSRFKTKFNFEIEIEVEIIPCIQLLQKYGNLGQMVWKKGKSILL